MAYAEQYPMMPGSGSAIGGTVSQRLVQDRPESELEAIATRIGQHADAAYELAAKLRHHADSVHGSLPECEKANACGSIRSGQLGAIYDALDRLASAQSELAEQAGRNCTLA